MFTYHCFISAMDIVTRLMSALTPRAVDTVTWLPREQNKLYPNGTAISTYGSYTEISEAITVALIFKNGYRFP